MKKPKVIPILSAEERRVFYKRMLLYYTYESVGRLVGFFTYISIESSIQHSVTPEFIQKEFPELYDNAHTIEQKGFWFGTFPNTPKEKQERINCIKSAIRQIETNRNNQSKKSCIRTIFQFFRFRI